MAENTALRVSATHIWFTDCFKRLGLLTQMHRFVTSRYQAVHIDQWDDHWQSESLMHHDIDELLPQWKCHDFDRRRQQSWIGIKFHLKQVVYRVTCTCTCTICYFWVLYSNILFSIPSISSAVGCPSFKFASTPFVSSAMYLSSPRSH